MSDLSHSPSCFRSSTLSWHRPALVLCAALVAALAPIGFMAAADTAAPPMVETAKAPGAGVLRLVSGGTVAGAFRASPEKETIVWQGEGFTRPFTFAAAAVSSIQMPADPTAKPTGTFGIELVGGDTLYGNLLKMDEAGAEFDVPQIGKILVKGDSLRRMFRIDGNPTLLFHGPAGLGGWKASDDGAWQEDGPHLKTDRQGAMLTRDFALPADIAIEFQIAWEKTPAFTFALGMNPDAAADHRQHGFRFEVWDRDLVVVRENPARADAAFLQTLSNDVKHIHLTVYLSQSKGELQVYGPDGKLQASIKVAPVAAKLGTGIRLINGAGDLRLEHLRIARWNGSVLEPVAEGQTRLQKSDGSLVAGQFVRFDEAAGEAVLKQEDQEVRVPLKDVTTLDHGVPAKDTSRKVAVVCQDGTRISGQLEEIGENQLAVSTPDIQDLVRLPLARVRTLSAISKEKPELPAPPAGRAGRIEVHGQKLPGRLVAGTTEAGGNCLVWQPDGSSTSSPLESGAAGRIVYRDPPPPVPAAQTQNRVEPQGNFAQIFLRNVNKGGAQPPASKKALTLHLVSGDMIPCTSLVIGEDGATIETPLARGQLVPHDQIKAIELIPGAPQPKLKNAKKDRLLTLPRLQKGSPPTHLLCARTGDFLRCRLVEMNQERIVVEIQLENVEIPRDRVAQIIWFHPEALEKAEGAKEETTETVAAPVEKTPMSPPAADGTAALASAPVGEFRAQILRRDGNRVTFFPEKVDDKMIAGRSLVLGACEFALADADQLIFGRSIELAAAELPYHQWKLHAALEPLIAQDLGNGGGEGPSGKESALVGKAAPDFELEMLTGGKFKLSDCKGQIVVLDFWATWCGPCMQTMPLVEKAIEEFDPKQVRLVAVNLEEPAKNVQSVLARHNLHVPVALDEDGVAARKYEANAIPQTVIVDREGKVHRLYVGGGPDMVEQLTTSLKELLAPAGETAKPAQPATGS